MAVSQLVPACRPAGPAMNPGASAPTPRVHRAIREPPRTADPGQLQLPGVVRFPTDRAYYPGPGEPEWDAAADGVGDGWFGGVAEADGLVDGAVLGELDGLGDGEGLGEGDGDGDGLGSGGGCWLGGTTVGCGPGVRCGGGAGGGWWDGGPGAGAGTAPTTRVAPKNAVHQMCAIFTTSPLLGASIMRSPPM